MPNLSSLGQHIKRYADLLPQSSTAAPMLREYFIAILKGRQFPDIEVVDDKISLGMRSRPYTFVRHKSGARMTIALREYGSDLLMTWTLWFGSSINWLLLGGVVVLFGLGATNLGGRSSVFGILCILAAIGLLVYAVLNGLISKKLDFFASEDMTALQLAVNHSLQAAIDQAGIEYKLRELESPSDISGNRKRAI